MRLHTNSGIGVPGMGISLARAWHTGFLKVGLEDGSPKSPVQIAGRGLLKWKYFQVAPGGV